MALNRVQRRMAAILAADVLPTLQDEGWIVVETRAFSDPAQ